MCTPNVIQNRNEHNLISDLKSEYEMYIHNENILDFIETNEKIFTPFCISNAGDIDNNSQFITPFYISNADYL
jgi:hypothetical protein